MRQQKPELIKKMKDKWQETKKKKKKGIKSFRELTKTLNVFKETEHK